MSVPGRTWVTGRRVARASFPAALAAALTVAVVPSSADAQPTPGAPSVESAGETVMATPRGRYEAGALHRWFLGDGHRDLWPLPVPARVLDLATFAGGLVPVEPGGGQQTRSLRFDGADGRLYTFRSIDKDAARTLDPVLQETLAARVLQDQVSALFPLSAMVVDPLLDAAGVLHADPVLVVMPDDPALGPFRAEFAGTLGWVEVRPDEYEDDVSGFAGSDRVVGSPRLFERLEERPSDRVDAPAFLRARLLDFLVGDWDRHPDQWRWAGFEEGGGTVFHPVPRDRDWALSRLDGLVARVTWVPWPHYVGFGPDYPSAFRLSWSGRALDRRLLAGLAWDDWEAVVDDLVARLDDEVLKGAVARLPAPYLEAEGPALTSALLRRRDRLPALAREFYELLAGWVDVDTTDEPELATIVRLPGDTVLVEVRHLRDGAPVDTPLYGRRFLPGETREVRLDLHGGDDRVRIEGERSDEVVIRIEGGGGDDVYEDRTGGVGLRLYDARGDNDLHEASDARFDGSRWRDPVDPEKDSHGAGYRSWGRRWVPVPVVAYSPDLGILLGAGAERRGYGFRHHPWASRFRVTAGFSSATGRADASVLLDVPLWRRTWRWSVGADLIAAETARFYGFGNATEATLHEDAYEASQREMRLDARVHRRVGEGVDLALGPSFAALRPDPAPGTLVDQVRPYGYGDFDRVALAVDARFDGRDEEGRGPTLALAARFHPALLDVASSFSSAGLAGTLHVGDDDLPFRPALALRVAGEKRWGRWPWHQAAFVGGAASLRGYPHQRFAGDASLFAQTEVRVFLTEFGFFVPGDLGLLALTDVGRVFMDGESPGGWHASAGGGVWASWLDALTVSAAVARGQNTSLYLTLGMPFDAR